MAFSDYMPLYRTSNASIQTERRRATSVVPPKTEKEVARLLKVASLALGYGSFYSLGIRTSFEAAPYDFDRINKAADTDSYVRQAISKYKELMVKEGWDIISENDEAIMYLRQRIDFMEMAMGKSFQDFILDVVDQFIRFNNVFIAKSRGDLNRVFPGSLNPVGDASKPLVGYYIIPAETVEIERDRHNRPKAYRQRVDSLTTGFSSGSNSGQPRWKASEVIHLSFDKKPGRAFGTPFMVSVLDDVVALRQIEEDVQNLVHKELFPLYKYRVGTEEMPADESEILSAVRELENLRNDGGLVLPERHDVEVIGAQGSSLDIEVYLAHFVNRVCVGLGLSPHHLGVMMNGGNRSVTDRLDVALYDKIKTYQRYLAEMIRLKFFSEILLEGGFNPVSHPASNGLSDRCSFVFKEIDVDTQVKKENHYIQLWINNVITFPELRDKLGLDKDVNEEELFANKIGSIDTEQELEKIKTTARLTPSPVGGSRKSTPNKRSVDNKSRPANQSGKRSSPNIRRSDVDWAFRVSEALGEKE